MSDQQPRGYALSMRIIHWVMAAMMIYVIIVGFMMGYGIKVGAHYDYHRATGFLILILILIRFGLKRISPPPVPLHANEPGLQRFAASAVHNLLYLTLVIQPILGWYATNAWGVKNIPFFFGWTLPQLVEKDRPLGNYLLELHHFLGLFVTALVLIHIGAALYHQFIKKDGLIGRMIRA